MDYILYSTIIKNCHMWVVFPQLRLTSGIQNKHNQKFVMWCGGKILDRDLVLGGL